ncbi:hypothetical protein RA24_21295 [Leisingera sp. ANG-M6]|nr:hypothetical protein RA24_21295 [Leisingera sp. ANG-M6]
MRAALENGGICLVLRGPALCRRGMGRGLEGAAPARAGMQASCTAPAVGRGAAPRRGAWGCGGAWGPPASGVRVRRDEVRTRLGLRPNL